MKKILIVNLLIFHSWIAIAGGDHAGNGGDFLRFIFEEGRSYGLNLVRKLKPCQLPMNVPGDVRNWILIHQNEFAIDLHNSKFIWNIDSNQKTCAFTQTNKAADIELSYEDCRSTIKAKENAALILFHEVVHHFGITDESFADWVAYAIYESQKIQSCSGNDGTDIFNSSYCSSQPMSSGEAIEHLNLPKSPKTVLGNFKITKRYRNCYTVGGCTSWFDANFRSAPLLFSGFQGEDGFFPAEPIDGEILIHLENDRPQFVLESNTAKLRAHWSTTGSVVTNMDYEYLLTLKSEINGLDLATNLYSHCLQHRMTGENFSGCSRGRGIFANQKTSLEGSDGEFKGRLANKCLWLYQKGSKKNTTNQGNSFITESEVVITGKF